MLRISLHPKKLDKVWGATIAARHNIWRLDPRRQYAACAPLPLGVPQDASASYEHNKTAFTMPKKLTMAQKSGVHSDVKDIVLLPNCHTYCTATTNSLSLYVIITTNIRYTQIIQVAMAISSFIWLRDRPLSHRANRRTASDGARFATMDRKVPLDWRLGTREAFMTMLDASRAREAILIYAPVGRGVLPPPPRSPSCIPKAFGRRQLTSSQKNSSGRPKPIVSFTGEFFASHHTPVVHSSDHQSFFRVECRRKLRGPDGARASPEASTNW